MQDPDNPYAAPLSSDPIFVSSEETNAERVRKAHLSHEASLQSWGTLYIGMGGLAAAIIVLTLIALIMRGVTRGNVGSDLVVSLMIGASGVAACVVMVTTGARLRQLDPKSRNPAIVLSILGLFALPCGTIINVYVLYLLLSRKGQTVFTAEYAEIRRQTPHIKYGMPLWNWIVLAMVAAPIGGFFVWIWLRT